MNGTAYYRKVGETEIKIEMLERERERRKSEKQKKVDEKRK